MVHSSSSSGIFLQGDSQSQALRNPHLSSYENSTNLIAGNMYANMIPVSRDISSTVMDSAASSLVTDANSGLSGGGPRLQKSASFNTESYMRLPASPLSFSSNNISVSGSSVIDGPSNQDPNSHQAQQQGPRHGASTATSLPHPRLGPMLNGPFNSDQDNIAQQLKRPRVEIKQEDAMQQQILRQILQRQDAMQFLQSLPPVQRAHLLQQQHLRQKLQEQSLQPSAALNQPYNGGVCSRRLMQYLYHQRQRPADISYWRKFVAEYYSPRAKKRWCLSLYNNVGNHSLGVFPPSTMDAWQCGICGSKSGRGFEATFEILPRLNDTKFSSGVIDELWFLDIPQECRFPSGIMVVEYGKAVQESVYEQLRVVHEGRLKVVFTPDLKILTWDFCARRHDELLPRRLVSPQVNQFLQVAQKCQSTIAESGSNGISRQDLQTNSNMVVAAGRQLARSLELQSLNDLGFSKRYVRTLQISEVFTTMKDLMDFTTETQAGPIEALNNFPRKRKREMEEMSSGIQGFSNLVGQMGGRGGPIGGPQAAMALSSYQNMLMRQSLMNSNSQQEASSSNPNRSPYQGLALKNNSANLPIGGQPPYQRFPSGIFQVQQNQHQQPPSYGGSQATNGGEGPKPSVSGQSGGGLTGSSSLKGGSHSDSCAGGEKAADLPPVSDVFQDIASELTENGFFNEDGAGYGWKA